MGRQQAEPEVLRHSPAPLVHGRLVADPVEQPLAVVGVRMREVQVVPQELEQEFLYGAVALVAQGMMAQVPLPVLREPAAVLAVPPGTAHRQPQRVLLLERVEPALIRVAMVGTTRIATRHRIWQDPRVRYLVEAVVEPIAGQVHSLEAPVAQGR
jgi:hypothetical protein